MLVCKYSLKLSAIVDTFVPRSNLWDGKNFNFYDKLVRVERVEKFRIKVFHLYE